MTKVHDLIHVALDGVDPRINKFPIAFIQWGNKEDGFQYEWVCPYCGHSVGWSILALQLAIDEAPKFLAQHYKKGCYRWGASTFDVEKAIAPLGTEKLPTVQ